jgi:hypothetical protein
VQSAFEQAPHFVGVGEAEKPQPLLVIQIGRVFPAQILHVEPIIEGIDERSDEPALVEQMHGLGWGINGIGVAR